MLTMACCLNSNKVNWNVVEENFAQLKCFKKYINRLSSAKVRHVARLSTLYNIHGKKFNIMNWWLTHRHNFLHI